ncbi:MAG: hypothetical protein AAB873_00405 [Patescibacteria group bacterium]
MKTDNNNQIDSKKSIILVIFGISGDLARRYLLPAVGEIERAQILPENFHIVGVTRKKDLKFESLLKKTADFSYLKEHASIFQVDVNNIEDYKRLAICLNEITDKFGQKTEKLFYLSIPPEAQKLVIESLGKSGLNKNDSKLLLEKPFGSDLESAKDLIKHTEKYFSKENVFRIDHYMAKELAQNILVFRDGNSLFKRTWNKDFIESIEIIASEQIDIEGRVNFYEQTGAMRDYVQNHLLQLLALVLMDLPKSFRTGGVIPNLRHKALKSLEIVDIVYGQYEGYKEEINNPSSQTETFTSVTLKSTDSKWKNVPIILTTGKALKERFTEIKILYKKEKYNESNELILQIQPEESIKFSILAKRPGYEHSLNSHQLAFKLREHYDILPDAYEKVLFDAINSDSSLFTTSNEVIDSWEILHRARKLQEKARSRLLIYKKGSSINDVMNIHKKNEE